MTKLEIELGKYVESAFSKEFDQIQVEAIRKSYVTFINNGHGPTKKVLFDIIKNVDYLSNNTAYEHIKKIITKKLFTNRKYIFLRFKSDNDASSNKLLTRLTSEGIIGDKSIKDIEQLKGIDRDTVVCLIDDFIGSGKLITDTYKTYLTGYYVLVICYSIAQRGLNELKKYSEIMIRANETRVTKDFKSLGFKKHHHNLINQIEESCANQEYSYGKFKTGVLVCFEGVCPNNTLSMFWYNKFNHPFNRWISPFHRSIHVSIINSIKTEIFRNHHNDIQSYYKNHIISPIFTLIDFKVFIAIRFNEYNVKELMDLTGISTVEQIREILNRSMRNQLLTVEEDEIILSDEILDHISNIYKKICNIEYNNRGY